jgi:hypothetical protein
MGTPALAQLTTQRGRVVLSGTRDTVRGLANPGHGGRPAVSFGSPSSMMRAPRRRGYRRELRSLDAGPRLPRALQARVVAERCPG